MYWLGLVGELRRTHRFDEATTRLRQARDEHRIDPTQYDMESKAIFNDRIEDLADQNDWETALAQSQEALARYPDDPSLQAQRELLADRKAQALDEREQTKVRDHYGERWATERLIVTPVAVEVAADLVPLVEGEGTQLHPNLSILVEEMRSRVREEYGVRVPGIRFRGNEGDMPDGTYIISMLEVPLVMGNQEGGSRLYLGEQATLDALFLKTQQAAHDPVTQAAGFWIASDDCQGRSKIRPPWRRKTRPSGRGVAWLTAAVRRRGQDAGAAAGGRSCCVRGDSSRR